MCMHVGSPLQKNAPIFGNVFTVTFNTNYRLLNNLLYIIHNKQVRLSTLYISTLCVFLAYIEVKTHKACALCACVRSALYKKTPRFLEMFFL